MKVGGASGGVVGGFPVVVNKADVPYTRVEMEYDLIDSRTGGCNCLDLVVFLICHNETFLIAPVRAASSDRGCFIPGA